MPAGELFIDGVRAVVQSMVDGDLQLRRRSIMQPSPVLPAIAVARKLRAKVAFEIELDRERNFLFFTIGRSTEKVADVRVRLMIEPAQPRYQPVAVPGFTLALPAVVRPTGNPQHLMLATGGKSSLSVLLPGGTDLMVLRKDALPVTAREGDPKPELYIQLIDTIAAWARTRTYGPALPLDLTQAEEAPLSRLLEQISSGLGELLQVLDRETLNEDHHELHQALAWLHPELAGSYRLRSLHADLLVRLDADGKLATSHGQHDTQQCDLQLRFLDESGGRQAAIRYWFPDLLVEGRYHERFVAALQRRKNIELLWRALPLKLQRPGSRLFGLADFREYVLDAVVEPSGVVFARVRRQSREQDDNLVLLRGRLRGTETVMLWKIEVKVTPYPEVRVKALRAPKLAYARIGRLIARENDHLALVHRYLVRKLGIMLAWQRLLAAGAVQ